MTHSTDKPGTMLVYDSGNLLHLPGATPGTPYTICGLDAGLMLHKERPMTWAGVWCSACLRHERQSRN